jgi:Cu/Ag efflux protein CusF
MPKFKENSAMKIRSKAALALACFLALAVVGVTQAVAQDVAHDVSGIVKHIDKGTKTMVVKAADGTEHTVKWTGKTSWEGTKQSGKGIKEGSEVSVKYTEKGGEKTADAVKVAGKDVGKAVSQ